LTGPSSGQNFSGTSNNLAKLLRSNANQRSRSRKDA
jgi:hypothetical protein